MPVASSSGSPGQPCLRLSEATYGCPESKQTLQTSLPPFSFLFLTGKALSAYTFFAIMASRHIENDLMGDEVR